MADDDFERQYRICQFEALSEEKTESRGTLTPVNVNRASMKDFCSLPNIGEGRAKMIIKARPLTARTMFGLDIPAAILSKLWLNNLITFSNEEDRVKAYRMSDPLLRIPSLVEAVETAIPILVDVGQSIKDLVYNNKHRESPYISTPMIMGNQHFPPGMMRFETPIPIAKLDLDSTKVPGVKSKSTQGVNTSSDDPLVINSPTSQKISRQCDTSKTASPPALQVSTPAASRQCSPVTSKMSSSPSKVSGATSKVFSSASRVSSSTSGTLYAGVPSPNKQLVYSSFQQQVSIESQPHVTFANVSPQNKQQLTTSRQSPQNNHQTGTNNSPQNTRSPQRHASTSP
jgi:hypothetical protein